jgi:hypothetical protein
MMLVCARTTVQYRNVTILPDPPIPAVLKTSTDEPTENSPLQVMTKLEIYRKLPEYHFFRFAENASKSSRKPRKMYVNLSEIRRRYD